MSNATMNFEVPLEVLQEKRHSYTQFLIQNLLFYVSLKLSVLRVFFHL